MALVAEDRIERSFTYEWASGAIVPAMSVALAILVGGVVMLVARNNPLNAYWQLAQGAFGGMYNLSETLVSSIPLMLTGLAVAFAFRAGLFNIGAEGQFYLGAILSALVGYKLNLSGILLVPVALIVGACGGAVWAGIAGILKAWRGAHEVITTMMLNYVALQLLHYLLEPTSTGKVGPMASTVLPGVAETPPMNATLPVIMPNALVANSRLHAGLIVALIMAVLFWFILWRTTLGYTIRAVGLNQKAAAYGGISVGWNIVIAMLIAGAFAGMAGMVTVFGLAPYQLNESLSANYGFNAIAVALLGKNTAAGTIAAAILFGALSHGGSIMQANAGISSHLIEIIQGLIIFFIAADAVIHYLARRGLVHVPRWQNEETAA